MNQVSTVDCKFLKIYEVVWSGDLIKHASSDSDTVMVIYARNHLDAGVLACEQVPGGVDTAGYPREICEMGISDVPSGMIRQWGVIFRGPHVRPAMNLENLRSRAWHRVEDATGLGEETWEVVDYK